MVWWLVGPNHLLYTQTAFAMFDGCEQRILSITYHIVYAISRLIIMRGRIARCCSVFCTSSVTLKREPKRNPGLGSLFVQFSPPHFQVAARQTPRLDGSRLHSLTELSESISPGQFEREGKPNELPRRFN